MDKNIAIIGGGFTGLTAAYRLSQEGYKVTIYEKSSNLGGLASGFQMNGENLEKVYHHIFRTDTDIIDLSKELEIEDKLMWLESSVGLFYKGKIYPFATPKDFLLFPPVSIIDRIRFGFVGLYLQKTNNWKSFEKSTAYEWMKNYSGKNITKVVWEPLLRGKFHEYYNKVSMAWLWARIHIRANSKAKGEKKEHLGYFDGGFDIITKALESKILSRKGEIFTDVNVDFIKKSDDGVIISVNNEERKFDKVIATVPSHIFSKLIEKNKLRKEYIDKLNAIDYLGAVVGVFSSDQKLSDFYWNNINDVNKPFLAFINHTNLIDKKKYGNHYVYYIGTYLPHYDKYFEMKDDQIYEEWFRALRDIFPNFDEKQVINKYLFKLKYAQHIVDLGYKDKIPSYKTPIKNLYLANFSQIYPEDRGTNYAVREGEKIAKLVMED